MGGRRAGTPDRVGGGRARGRAAGRGEAGRRARGEPRGAARGGQVGGGQGDAGHQAAHRYQGAAARGGTTWTRTCCAGGRSTSPAGCCGRPSSCAAGWSRPRPGRPPRGDRPATSRRTPPSPRPARRRRQPALRLAGPRPGRRPPVQLHDQQRGLRPNYATAPPSSPTNRPRHSPRRNTADLRALPGDAIRCMPQRSSTPSACWNGPVRMGPQVGAETPQECSLRPRPCGTRWQVGAVRRSMPSASTIRGSGHGRSTQLPGGPPAILPGVPLRVPAGRRWAGGVRHL